MKEILSRRIFPIEKTHNLKIREPSRSRCLTGMDTNEPYRRDVCNPVFQKAKQTIKNDRRRDSLHNDLRVLSITSKKRESIIASTCPFAANLQRRAIRQSSNHPDRFPVTDSTVTSIIKTASNSFSEKSKLFSE